MQRSIWAPLIVATMALCSCEPRNPASASCPDPSLDLRGLPDDKPCSLRRIDDFGNLAWETFKTLVWPAKMQDSNGATVRGKADPDRKLTDMTGPRVFETFKTDWETYDAGQPLAWHRYPPLAPICKNMPLLRPGSLVLASLHKFGNLEIGTDSPPNGITHVLVGQNRHFVRYLTAYGEKAFNSILDHKLYDPIDLRPSPGDPEAGRTKMDRGTLTIKSAWLEVTGLADPGDFFVREAWVQNPADMTCEQKKVALVGLHIAHKTEASPQWIWMSFEHFRNVPPFGSRGIAATFSDGQSTMPSMPPTETHTPLRSDNIPAPYNVERSKPIPEAIENVNEKWRNMLSKRNSVWSNYQLVVVQWPGQPFDETRTGSGLPINGKYSAAPTPPCRAEAGTNLANSVIETFVQPHTDCYKRTTCMTCHNEARSYDFIWSIPLAHKSAVSAVASTTARQSSIAILREIVEQDLRR